MKKTMAAVTGLCMATSLLVGSPGYANSEMRDSSAVPDPSTYTVHEFSVEVQRFGGSQRIRLAVPNLVRCPRFPSVNNCTAYLRASAESSVSVSSMGIGGPNVWAYLFAPGSSAPLASSLGAEVSPFIEDGKPLGTGWKQTIVRFSMEQSGTLTIRLKKNLFDRDYLTSVSIPLVVSVQTRDEFLAEAEAIRKEEEDKAARAAAAEAARNARILATKLTVTCKAGSKTRKVSGDPPVCPKGFSNPMASQPAFQAYSKCKLYKKTQGFARAKLQDAGKTLNVDGYGRSASQIDFNRADWACVTKAMKVPSSVLNKIGQTRALDGMVSAQFGSIKAFWTYHPDDGLDITFSR